MEKREKARQYWFVVQQLTARELKRKYARSVLGVVWSVLNPLLSMAVLSLIFSQLFRRSIENYPIYYLTGYLLWQAFTATTNAAMTTLADNRALLLKVKFPMELFILTRGATALVNLGYSLVAYGVMLVVFQVPLRWTLAYLPAVVACLFLFALGISYLLSAAYVFFGDIKHLYSVALTLWMYCSAIFYPADQLSGFIRQVVEANPLYLYIRCLRGAVMEGLPPAGWELDGPTMMGPMMSKRVTENTHLSYKGGSGFPNLPGPARSACKNETVPAERSSVPGDRPARGRGERQRPGHAAQERPFFFPRARRCFFRQGERNRGVQKKTCFPAKILDFQHLR